MADNSEYLTKEKFDELEKELQVLKTDRRKEVAENLEYAKSLGDLSENAEYHEARETQANLEDRISKLEAILKSAVIVAPYQGERVGIGSTVKLEKGGGREVSTITYKVVGSEEADISQNKISIHSPLGAAMINKKKGDSFSVNTPGGAVSYAIVSVE
jgi:transcription elongation factor GreA